MLAIGTLSLIFFFKSASALTNAYGIAINLLMILTTLLIIYLSIKKWHWSLTKVIFVFALFCVTDVVFLAANAQKIWSGGWVPIAIATLCAFVMYTWNKGRSYLYNNYYLNQEKLSIILKQLDYSSFKRLPDTTAIFITDTYDKSGGSLFHFLKLNHMLPEHIIIVNYAVENIPHVSLDKQFIVNNLKENICELTLNYGFMDTISIPTALTAAHNLEILPFPVDIDKATYMLEIPNVVPSGTAKALWFVWQEKLFAFLVRNYSANLNIEFYQLPYNRTIAIGAYYMI